MKPVRVLRRKTPPEMMALLLIFLAFFFCMRVSFSDQNARWIFSIFIGISALAVVHALFKDNWVELNPAAGTIVSMRTSWYFKRRETSYLVSEFAAVRTTLIYDPISATHQARVELVTKDRNTALEIDTFGAIFEKLPAWSFHLLRESIEDPKGITLRRQVSEILGIPDHGYSQEVKISLLP
jgi:hypothetical protein